MALTITQQRIIQQRKALENILSTPLRVLSSLCAEAWSLDKFVLNDVLRTGMVSIPYCHSLYIMDTDGQQISDSIERTGQVIELEGKDRSDRPYLNYVPTADFILSESYISDFSRKPCLTAVQIVRVGEQTVGFVAALFYLRDLPLTAALYDEPTCWRQLKGDPSIRNTLFYQQRSESVLDQHIQDVLSSINELIVERGIFHVDIHFSSNRAMIWSSREPCKYHILALDDLIDTDVCLAYGIANYPANAVIPADKVEEILTALIDLRFADDTIYLRIGSINIYNGLIGLTFSCDGSHYMHYEEFLGKKLAFWIGEAEAGTSTIP